MEQQLLQCKNTTYLWEPGWTILSGEKVATQDRQRQLTLQIVIPITAQDSLPSGAGCTLRDRAPTCKISAPFSSAQPNSTETYVKYNFQTKPSDHSGAVGILGTPGFVLSMQKKGDGRLNRILRGWLACSSCIHCFALLLWREENRHPHSCHSRYSGSGSAS